METCLVIEEQTGTKTDPTEKATGTLSDPEHCNWVLLRAAERRIQVREILLSSKSNRSRGHIS
jgi:hypothetical protein